MSDEMSIEVIKTSDFTLASTLLTLGFDVIGLDKTNPRRVIFIFRRTSDLETALASFRDNEVRINPKDFVYSQRELKDRINTNI